MLGNALTERTSFVATAGKAFLDRLATLSRGHFFRGYVGGSADEKREEDRGVKRSMTLRLRAVWQFIEMLQDGHRDVSPVKNSTDLRPSAT
jgi:hypothetical protein